MTSSQLRGILKVLKVSALGKHDIENRGQYTLNFKINRLATVINEAAIGRATAKAC